MTERPLPGRVVAELVGTALLLATVVGSGAMAASLTTDAGLRLLLSALATAGVLTALILALGPASGAHLNPAVTLADRLLGGIPTRDACAYVAAQFTGGIVGVLAANLMFDLPVVARSRLGPRVRRRPGGRRGRGRGRDPHDLPGRVRRRGPGDRPPPRGHAATRGRRPAATRGCRRTATGGCRRAGTHVGALDDPDTLATLEVSPR